MHLHVSGETAILLPGFHPNPKGLKLSCINPGDKVSSEEKHTISRTPENATAVCSRLFLPLEALGRISHLVGRARSLR